MDVLTDINTDGNINKMIIISHIHKLQSLSNDKLNIIVKNGILSLFND